MARFDWDPSVESANVEKYGMDFLTALELWSKDHLELAARPGVGEDRRLVIGDIWGWVWTAVTAQRGDTTRIIAVRRADENEREALYACRRRGHGAACGVGGD